MTLPKPHQLGVDVAQLTGSMYKNSSAADAVFPDVVALKCDPTGEKLTAIYSDRSLYIWDVKDPKMIGKYRSFLSHSDCVWGVEVCTQLPGAI